jgi:hypothetical protein
MKNNKIDATLNDILILKNKVEISRSHRPDGNA